MEYSVTDLVNHLQTSKAKRPIVATSNFGQYLKTQGEDVKTISDFVTEGRIADLNRTQRDKFFKDLGEALKSHGISQIWTRTNGRSRMLGYGLAKNQPKTVKNKKGQTVVALV